MSDYLESRNPKTTQRVGTEGGKLPRRRREECPEREGGDGGPHRVTLEGVETLDESRTEE